MSIGEVEIRGHMDGFSHDGQATAHLRNEQPAQPPQSLIRRVRRGWSFLDSRFGEFDACVILRYVEMGNNVTLRRVVVDQRCRLPDGLKADVDPAADRRPFHVTDPGVTVIVPENLGQRVHHLR